MKRLTLLFAFTLLLFVSCNKDDDPTPQIAVENEIKDFVWKGLNAEYYWQDKVPNLADTKNDDISDYNTYLSNYGSPEDLFATLLYQPGETDRFSWFIEDYNEQAASFRGVNDAFGFEFGLERVGSTDFVVGYVTYVVPNSPAADVNMKRGDYFTEFNGTTLTMSNYTIVNGYYRDNNISLGFADYDNGTYTKNGKTVNLTLRQVIENPVHYKSIIESNGKKIGYLVYNGFKYPFHTELNDVFGEFQTAGIDELILDLRYNGGGSVLTSAYLASMIYGNASDTEVFAKLIYNTKNAKNNGGYFFENRGNVYDQDGNKSGEITLNRLTNLSRVFIITSDDTASASEMIINGLKPFMDVKTVGTTTYGKNVGSYTVYDSPDFTNKNVNPNHTNAMQPITFRIFNKLDQSDYIKGFKPNFKKIEYAADIKDFGDLNEPLLNTALAAINGDIPETIAAKSSRISTKIFSSREKEKFSKEMYIIPSEIE
ncbi:S41 family peptidase [Flavobacteriaceae bacterium F08102]|nr:S41 family peptidase [Flavobacteriaceae bacterium F08102]